MKCSPASKWQRATTRFARVRPLSGPQAHRLSLPRNPVKVTPVRSNLKEISPKGRSRCAYARSTGRIYLLAGRQARTISRPFVSPHRTTCGCTHAECPAHTLSFVQKVVYPRLTSKRPQV